MYGKYNVADGLLVEVGGGVDGGVILAHFVVYVGAGRVAAFSELADRLTSAHGVACFNQPLVEMGVGGRDAVAVVDDYNVSVVTLHAGKGDVSRGGAVYGGTIGAGNVDAFVQTHLTGVWVATHAEGGGYFGGGQGNGPSAGLAWGNKIGTNNAGLLRGTVGAVAKQQCNAAQEE